jgi:hypothetical protein
LRHLRVTVRALDPLIDGVHSNHPATPVTINVNAHAIEITYEAVVMAVSGVFAERNDTVTINVNPVMFTLTGNTHPVIGRLRVSKGCYLSRS